MSPLLKSISSSNCKVTDIEEDACGKSPSYVPTSAVNCRPVVIVPTTVGAVATLGLKCCLSTIGYVWFVIATSEPAMFVPVIHTRIANPMSCTVGVYVLVVTPGISTQVARSPTGLQRRHE